MLSTLANILTALRDIIVTFFTRKDKVFTSKLDPVFANAEFFLKNEIDNEIVSEFDLTNRIVKKYYAYICLFAIDSIRELCDKIMVQNNAAYLMNHFRGSLENCVNKARHHGFPSELIAILSPYFAKEINVTFYGFARIIDSQSYSRQMKAVCISNMANYGIKIMFLKIASDIDYILNQELRLENILENWVLKNPAKSIELGFINES